MSGAWTARRTGGHMAEVGRFRPFAGSSTNDCMGSKAATRSCGSECPLQRPRRPKPASLLPAISGHLASASVANIHSTLPRYRVDNFLTAMQFSPDGEELFRAGARRIGMK